MWDDGWTDVRGAKLQSASTGKRLVQRNKPLLSGDVPADVNSQVLFVSSGGAGLCDLLHRAMASLDARAYMQIFSCHRKDQSWKQLLNPHPWHTPSCYGQPELLNLTAILVCQGCGLKQSVVMVLSKILSLTKFKKY
jgi:hypothetical protein